MYIYTRQCMHYIYGCSQPCLTLLTNCNLVACNNYITTRLNLIINQWLLCNKCTTLTNTYNHSICIHFHCPIYMTFQLIYNYYAIIFQLKIFNLKIWNLGGKPLSKWHMTIYQQICPNASTTFMRLCLWAFIFALRSSRFLFLLLKKLKAFVFAFVGWRFLFLLVERLKVLALREVEGFCFCFWMLKVFVVCF